MLTVWQAILCVCAFLYLSSFFRNYIHTVFVKTTIKKDAFVLFVGVWNCLTFLCYTLLFVHFRALLNIVFNYVVTVFLCVGCPSTWLSFISGIGMSMNSVLEFMKFGIHGHSYNLSPLWMARSLMKGRISVLKDLTVLKYVGMDLFIYLYSCSMRNPLLEEYE